MKINSSPQTGSSNRLIWPIALACVIFLGSSGSGPQVAIPYFDKVAHFFVFGLFATLIFRYKECAPASLGHRFMAVLLTSLYGAVDELHQYSVPGRIFDGGDILADLLGAFVAVWVYAHWTPYRNILETDLFELLSKDRSKKSGAKNTSPGIL